MSRSPVDGCPDEDRECDIEDDAVRSRRLHEAAAIAATIGVTCFFAWFITGATGPRWLHTLSVPAALAFIAAGAVVAGYAGWIGGP